MMLVLVTKWFFLPACNGMIHITVESSPELTTEILDCLNLFRYSVTMLQME